MTEEQKQMRNRFITYVVIGLFALSYIYMGYKMWQSNRNLALTVQQTNANTQNIQKIVDFINQATQPPK